MPQGGCCRPAGACLAIQTQVALLMLPCGMATPLLQNSSRHTALHGACLRTSTTATP